jgi:hypothetical protein
MYMSEKRKNISLHDLYRTDKVYEQIVNFLQNKIPGHELLPSDPLYLKDSLFYFYWHFANGDLDAVAPHCNFPDVVAITQELVKRGLIEGEAGAQIIDAAQKLEQKRALAGSSIDGGA